jgi:hypothetical protein
LRLFAGIIDFLQFIFFIVLLAFQLMTPVGGGVTGAAAGAYLCYNASSGVISGLIEGAKCAIGGTIVGAGLSAFAIPAGIAIDMAISCTFGVLLILALWVTGRLSFMAIAIGFTSEMLPGLNAFIPGWSLLVHRSIQQYKKKQKIGGTSATTSTVSLLDAARMIPFKRGGTAAALARRVPATAPIPSVPGSQQTGRVPLQTRNFDGIRPTNSNRPQSYAQAA